MLSFLIIVLILLTVIYLTVQVIILLVKRDARAAIRSIIILVSIFISAIVLLHDNFKQEDTYLIGFSLDYGNTIIDYYEPEYIKENGIIITIFKGDPKKYKKLLEVGDSFYELYPSEKLNKYNMKYVQKWKYMPIEEKDSSIIKFIENELNGIEDITKKKKTKNIFKRLQLDTNTLYSYFFNGKGADFWMINPVSAYYAYFSCYKTD